MGEIFRKLRIEGKNFIPKATEKYYVSKYSIYSFLCMGKI